MKPIGNIFGFDCVTCEHNRNCYGGNMGNQFRYCQKSIEKVQNLDKLEQENQKYKKRCQLAIEYINKYAWQEDIIGGIYTTNGKPATDRYMKLEWDNCNELLDILKGSDSNE